jgi:hypothetical protein
MNFASHIQIVPGFIRRINLGTKRDGESKTGSIPKRQSAVHCGGPQIRREECLLFGKGLNASKQREDRLDMR